MRFTHKFASCFYSVMFCEVRAIDKYMFLIARASRRISDKNNVWGG